MRSCVAAVNGLDERAGNTGPSLWLEDEIIGWLYQFYNAEQKEAIRKRGKPRRPAEVAVINQFFTPRWVVKFLVDNTLGRLWLEMHPDSERVRESVTIWCRSRWGRRRGRRGRGRGKGRAGAGDSRWIRTRR